MKFLHTSDWHIGRTLNGFSLLEEQKYAFEQILSLAKQNQVDGIIIAGDLYDRAVPSAESVITFNQMLREMNIIEKFPIYMISGNHDGAKRLSYAKDWLDFNNLHLRTSLEEAFIPVETKETQIFLLPFFDPMDARIYFSNQGLDEDDTKQIKTIDDAMTLVISKMKSQFNNEKNQVLVTHFAVSPHKEEIVLTSETSSKVGGLSTLNVSQFADFDYVALGHIHTRLASPSDKVQYSGSPVKFNTKEASTPKGIFVVEIKEKMLNSNFLPLQVKTDLVVLEEEWEQLINRDFYERQPLNKAWFAITIKNFDRTKLVGQNLRAQLQKIYGTIIELDYQFEKRQLTRSRSQDIETLDNVEILSSFYKFTTGETLDDVQIAIIESTFNELEGEK